MHKHILYTINNQSFFYWPLFYKVEWWHKMADSFFLFIKAEALMILKKYNSNVIAFNLFNYSRLLLFVRNALNRFLRDFNN